MDEKLRTILIILGCFFLGVFGYLLISSSGTAGFDTKYMGYSDIDPETPLLAAHSTSCFNYEGEGYMRVLLENYGQVSIDLGDVDMTITRGTEGDPLVSMEGLNMTAEGRVNDPDVAFYKRDQVNDAATYPGDRSFYQFALGDTFEEDVRYEVTFTVHEDNGDVTASHNCRARQANT